MKIRDIVDFNKDVLNGNILTNVKIYNWDNKDAKESDWDYIKRLTYETKAIRETKNSISDSLMDNAGKFFYLVNGDFGSGKSHYLLYFVHYLNDMYYKPIVIHFSQKNYKNIWQPILESLNYDASYTSYPALDDMNKIFNNRKIAIFIDEIEDWYLSQGESERADTRAFLRTLCEYVSQHNNLFIFISLRGESSDLSASLQRSDPYLVELNDQIELEDILLYRIIDKKPSLKQIKQITGPYIAVYKKYNFASRKLVDRFAFCYPFHPLIIHYLVNSYKNAEKRQNLRGTLFLFSRIIPQILDKQGVIKPGDIKIDGDMYNELAKIDEELCERYLEEAKNIKYRFKYEYLNSILMAGMAKEEIDINTLCMLAIKPSQDINRLYNEVYDILKSSMHLINDNGMVKFSQDINIFTYLRNKAVEMINTSKESDNNTVSEEVSRIISSRVDPKYHIRFISSKDIVEDTSDFKVIFLSKNYNDDELYKFFYGRRFQNSFVLILTNNIDLELNREFLILVQLLIILKDKLVTIEEKQRQDIIRQTENDIFTIIKNSYGYIVRPIASQGKIKGFRRILLNLNNGADVLSGVLDKDDVVIYLQGQHENGELNINNILSNCRAFVGTPTIPTIEYLKNIVNDYKDKYGFKISEIKNYIVSINLPSASLDGLDKIPYNASMKDITIKFIFNKDCVISGHNITGKGEVGYQINDIIDKMELENILKDLTHRFDGEINITGTVVEKL